MSTIRDIDLTLYGQTVSGLSVTVGTTVNWNLLLQDPDTRAVLNLTGLVVVMALNALDLKGNPILPAIVARQATITLPLTGAALVPWANGDLIPSGTQISSGSYGIEVWLEDSDGNRIQQMGNGIVEIVASGYLPSDPITPLPEQDPLAIGPAGITWRGVYNNAATYAVTDGVYYTATGITSSYRAILAGTGHLPTNATYWEPLALGGGGSGLGTVTTVTSSTTALTVGTPTTTPNLTIANAVAEGAPGLQSGADKTKQDGTSTDASFIATQHTWSKAQNVAAVALTDASSIATDAALSNVFTVTLGGNRTLANPTNLVAGGTYIWIVTQDGTGSKTLAYGSVFKWPAGSVPVLTTTANRVDMISAVYNGTILLAAAMLDVR